MRHGRGIRREQLSLINGAGTTKYLYTSLLHPKINVSLKCKMQNNKIVMLCARCVQNAHAMYLTSWKLRASKGKLA